MKPPPECLNSHLLLPFDDWLRFQRLHRCSDRNVISFCVLMMGKFRMALTLTRFTFTAVRVTNGPHLRISAHEVRKRARMYEYVNDMSVAANASMNRAENIA